MCTCLRACAIRSSASASVRGAGRDGSMRRYLLGRPGLPWSWCRSRGARAAAPAGAHAESTSASARATGRVRVRILACDTPGEYTRGIGRRWRAGGYVAGSLIGLAFKSLTTIGLLIGLCPDREQRACSCACFLPSSGGTTIFRTTLESSTRMTRAVVRTHARQQLPSAPGVAKF